MDDAPLKIARLTGAGADDDGATVRFRIEAADGRATDLTCDHDQIERLIQFLAGLGRMSAERRSDVTPHRFGATDNISVTPIEISDVGFMRGMTTEEAVLVVRMFGFDLGFSVTPFQLRALHAEIERMLPKSALQPDDHHHHGHGHHHHEDGDDGG